MGGACGTYETRPEGHSIKAKQTNLQVIHSESVQNSHASQLCKKRISRSLPTYRLQKPTEVTAAVCVTYCHALGPRQVSERSLLECACNLMVWITWRSANSPRFASIYLLCSVLGPRMAHMPILNNCQNSSCIFNSFQLTQAIPAAIPSASMSCGRRPVLNSALLSSRAAHLGPRMKNLQMMLCDDMLFRARGLVQHQKRSYTYSGALSPTFLVGRTKGPEHLPLRCLL